MTMSPEYAERLATGLRTTMDNLEGIILERLARRLSTSASSPSYESDKLAQVQAMKNEISSIVTEFTGGMNAYVANVIQQAFDDGVRGADDDFQQAKKAIAKASVETATSPMARLAVASLVAEATGAISNTHFHILRKSEDIYRQTIARTAVSAISGVETTLQTVQRTINEFADKGITGFVDKAGRNWSIGAYADMAIRSAIGRSAQAGHEMRLTDLGEDLVIVSQHPDECPVCRKWEGKILSISGTHPTHQSLQRAKSEGLFHQNCGHVATAYFEGYTKPMPEKMGRPTDYEEKQEQRAIERQIRKWKNRQAVAVTNDEKMRADKKVKEWQAHMRDFTKRTGRRRQRDREQVNFGAKPNPSQFKTQPLDTRINDKPPEPPTPSGTHKPVMTREEAKVWAKDSAYKTSFYHGTDKSKIQTIETEGLKNIAGESGQYFGSGIYLSGSKKEAQYWANYSEFGQREGDVVEVMVNVKKPLILNLDNPKDAQTLKKYEDIGRERYGRDFKKSQWEYMTDAMKADGYDSLKTSSRDIDRGGDQLVVFDERNVTVIKDPPKPKPIRRKKSETPNPKPTASDGGDVAGGDPVKKSTYKTPDEMKEEQRKSDIEEFKARIAMSSAIEKFGGKQYVEELTKRFGEADEDMRRVFLNWYDSKYIYNDNYKSGCHYSGTSELLSMDFEKDSYGERKETGVIFFHEVGHMVDNISLKRFKDRGAMKGTSAGMRSDGQMTSMYSTEDMKRLRDVESTIKREAQAILDELKKDKRVLDEKSARRKVEEKMRDDREKIKRLQTELDAQRKSANKSSQKINALQAQIRVIERELPPMNSTKSQIDDWIKRKADTQIAYSLEDVVRDFSLRTGHSGVSDMISGAFENQVFGLVHTHSEEYWRFGVGKLMTESIAHTFQAQFYRESREAMMTHFPESYSKLLSIIKELA